LALSSLSPYRRYTEKSLRRHWIVPDDKFLAAWMWASGNNGDIRRAANSYGLRVNV
jgi:hypothetical protein